MKIFFGERDINYNKPNKYDFLNWRVDDGYGYNDKQKPEQPVFDNYEMGKAYLANAVLTLYAITHRKSK